MWIEVFRTGTFTDANGQTKTWTIEDLDEIVRLYNNQPENERHEAPVVIGHPTDNSPAYGWVRQLKREGDVLLAEIVDIDPDFERLVNEGRYKKVSIALYPDLKLRHVGFLGAIPPAVKGLEPVKFNENIDFIYFSFDEKNVEASLNNNLNNDFNIDFQTNVKQTNEGQNMDENFEKLLSDLIEWLRSTFNEEIANQTAKEIENLKLKYFPQQEQAPQNTTEGTTENSPQMKEFKELQKRIEQLENENYEMKFNEYFNSQLGRLTPAQRPIVKLAFELARSNKSFEFSENGMSKRLTGEEIIRKLIESFPVQINFNEFATNNDALKNDDLQKQTEFIEKYYKGRKK